MILVSQMLFCILNNSIPNIDASIYIQRFIVEAGAKLIYFINRWVVRNIVLINGVEKKKKQNVCLHTFIFMHL